MLNIVEGLTSVPIHRASKVCSLCNGNEGVCIGCEACASEFHVSCAWSAGYRFAFEVLPPRTKEGVTVIKFKTEEGVLKPLVICKKHAHNPNRLLYDLGQKEPSTKLVGLGSLSTIPAQPADAPMMALVLHHDVCTELQGGQSREWQFPIA